MLRKIIIIGFFIFWLKASISSCQTVQFGCKMGNNSLLFMSFDWLSTDNECASSLHSGYNIHSGG